MKNYFITATVLFLAAVLLSCGGKPVVHKGSFKNSNNQHANDLHIVFDKEGVTYDPSESITRMTSRVVSENGKTTIDLDGNTFSNAIAQGLVFKRKGGDFNVEKWWWTIKEGDQSVMLGIEHTGPPNTNDDSGNWR